ncbi:hypothetical protein PM082_019205 [Marasmius tenuissimus]|nr:hypothetical protein PM082_019205 [Marasmius tenuissimus]
MSGPRLRIVICELMGEIRSGGVYRTNASAILLLVMRGSDINNKMTDLQLPDVILTTEEFGRVRVRGKRLLANHEGELH